MLLYRFFADLFVLVIQLPQMNWHDLVTNVLNLVDLALTANLILIVIFSSYENFIRRIDPADHPDWPEGLTQVDFGELKQKLLGSIVGIAAVDALAWYFDLEKEPDTTKLDLGAGVPAHLRRLHADPRHCRPARPPAATRAQAEPNCRISAAARDNFPRLSGRLGIINLNRR